ncbi:DNA helicase, partial [Salmonella enterica]|nr:DNA helicase [Salmonella enterica]
PDRLKTLWQQRVEDEREADVTVCTAHRSKGLEWDTVKLYDDFADILDPEMPADKRDDELNLLYVATTRARRTLVPDPVVLEVLAQPPAEDILSRQSEGNSEAVDNGDDGNDGDDSADENVA